MSLQIEQMYQEIGKEALSLVEGLAGKLLVYAEVQDGVISADVFYVNQGGFVRFLFCPTPMKELIYSFWEEWKKQSDNREWKVMIYVIDGGKFSIDLKYADQLKKDENVSDRRPVVIKEYFGDMSVDYSRPR